MAPPRRRGAVANWGALQIIAEQTLGLLVMLVFDPPGHAPVKLRSRIERSNLFALLRHDNERLRLTLFHGVVADVVDKLGGFRMQFQSFGELGVGGYKVLFLASAISLRVMAFGGIDRKSTRLNSSHANISYAGFCLKKKKKNKKSMFIYS